MSGKFDDFDRVMYQMIQDFGFLATYKKCTPGVADDAAGTISDTFEDVEIEAIKTELLRPNNGLGSKIGSLIQEGDQILYIRPTEKTSVFADPLYVNPALDKVMIGNTLWKIVTMKEHNTTNEDCILYELYIRK